MVELVGMLGRSVSLAPETAAATKARLARVKREAKAEAYIRAQSAPLSMGSFDGFLRSGSY